MADMLDSDITTTDGMDGESAQLRATTMDLVDAVCAAESKDAAVAALAGAMDDAGRLASMRRLWERDTGAWESACAQMAAVRGCSRVVGRLRRLVEIRSAGLRLVDPNERPVLPDVVPDGYEVPVGWETTPQGIWRMGTETNERVSVAPIYVVGRLVDVDTKAHALELAWPTWRGGWTREVVPASVAADARALISLSALGAPVTSANAGRLVEYLDASRGKNAPVLPLRLTAQRMGWMEGGFLLGEQWLGDVPHVVQWRGDEGQQQLAEAYRSRGTWEGWLELATACGRSESAWLAIYAPIASVLIHYVGAPDGWTIDWSSETSGGKTTILRAAASVCGDPGRVIRPWKTSMAGLEAYCATLRHLPPCLDDSKKAKTRDMVADVLYMQSGGMGQTRGKPGGHGQGVALRRTETWCSGALSTGEERATSFTQDAGARARTLCLVGDPLASREQADRIAAITAEHHGHLLPRVVRRLLEDGTREAATARYRQLRSYFGERLGQHGAVAGRLGDIVAMLCFAAEVSETVGLPKPPDGIDPIQYAGRCAISGGEDSDRPGDALRALASWAVAHQETFFGRAPTDKGTGEDRAPARGWSGAWRGDDGWTEIGFTSSALRDALGDAGYKPEAISGIVERWAERGWLAPGDDGRAQRRAKVGDARTRLYVFPRDVMEREGGM